MSAPDTTARDRADAFRDRVAFLDDDDFGATVFLDRCACLLAEDAPREALQRGAESMRIIAGELEFLGLGDLAVRLRCLATEFARAIERP